MSQKKILIVSKSVTSEVRSVIEHTSDDCSFEVMDVTDPHQDLSLYDVIYWRSASITAKFSRTAGRHTVLQLHEGKSKIINSFLSRSPQLVQKSVQQALVRSRLFSVSTIPTYFANTSNEFASLIEDGSLSLPVIAKPNIGAQGRGAVLLRNINDFSKIKKPGDYILQDFIENDYDYRILIVGGVALDVRCRRRKDTSVGSSYLNNVSKGAAISSVEDLSLWNKLQNISERIATAFDMQVCGIDLIIDKRTGEIFFMEINSVVQWEASETTVRSDVGKRVADLLSAYAEVRHDNRAESGLAIVHKYHLENEQFYPVSKRFHFNSRMYLHTRKEIYRKSLDEIREAWEPSKTKLINDLQTIPNLTAADLPKLTGKYRAPYHQAHPKISKYNKVLFKCLFIAEVYNASIENIINAIDRRDIESTKDLLINDEESLLALSTPAVNFLTLYRYALNNEPITANELLRIGKQPTTLQRHEDLHARIYYFTHIIIGASDFYARRIEDNHSVYVEMLEYVEQLVLDNYTQVSLDQKFEVLVCAKLLDVYTQLRSVVTGEMGESIAEVGFYYVDTLNAHRTKHASKSFSRSEHRNVLALMAFS